MKKSKKRWSLARAAVYGLLFAGFLVVLRMAGIGLPLPAGSGAYTLGYWFSYFAAAAILLVVVAAIRNAVVRAPKVGAEEDDTAREWTDVDKAEFKRAMDRQRQSGR